MPMPSSDLLVDFDDHVLTLTFNRPEKLNAVTYDMQAELMSAFERADRDDAVRAVIVTGRGKGFCAGTDLSAGGLARMTGEGNAPPPAEGKVPRDKGGPLALRIFNSNKPYIAAINGVAAGMGAALTLPMDVRIGTPAARYAFPYVRRGIGPESCSSWFLPRLVGVSRALEWMSTGRTVSAQDALDAGLLSKIVPDEQLQTAARELGLEIARNASSMAVALTRRMVWRGVGYDHPMYSHRLESQGLHAMSATGDPREGVRAFAEKRTPQFPARPSVDLPADFPWWEEPPYE